MRTMVLAVFAVGMMLVGCDSGEKPVARDYRDEPTTSANATTKITTRRAPATRSSRSQPDFEKRQHRSVISETLTTGPTVQVSGYVVYKGGAAATSATIELWSKTGEHGKLLPESTRLGSAQVGKDGNYSLHGPDGEKLRALVKNAPFAIAEIHGSKPDTTATVIRKVTQNFTLPASTDLQGKVLTGDDQAVSGALVSMQSEDIEDDGWFYGNQQTTTTVAGDFNLPNVASGPATIGAVADGFPPVTQKINLPTSGPLVIRLTTGTATINGTVVHYPTEAPISGGKVQLLASTKADLLGLDSSISTPIESNGAFQLTQLAAGPASLGVVSASGRNLWPAPVPFNGANLTLSSGETTTIRLVVFEGYTVAGTVFDKDTSEPLSGATVKVGQDSKAIAQSDESGQYSIKALKPAVAYAVEATLAGYGVDPESTIGYPAKLEAKVTTASIHLLLDIPMERLVTVSGHVENEEAFPVPNAAVRWRHNRGADVETITDGAGKFRVLTSPFSQGIFEVEAEGYAFKRTTETVSVVMDDVDDILITLERAGVVEGRVVNEAGEGVPSAAIYDSDEFFQIGSSFMQSLRKLTSSDVTGSFHIKDLASGKHTLQASAKGYGKGTNSLEIKAGETLSGVEIKLPNPAKGMIAGRVVDEEDLGVKATVILPDYGSVTPAYAKTDEEGRFELKAVPEVGEVNIMVLAENPSRTIKEKVRVGDRNVLIKFDDEAVLVGRVEDAITGEVIKEFELSGFGSWDRKGLSPGEFKGRMRPNSFNNLTISAEGYPKQTFKVKAPAETGEFRQTFKMHLGGGLRGRVVYDGTRKPVSNTPVAAYNMLQSQNEPVGSTVTDEDGAFLISRLPPGKSRVTAIPAAPLAPASRSIEVKDGEVADIGDVEIGASGSIYGQVVRLPTRTPETDVYININGPKGDESVQGVKPADSNGNYAFDGLPAGTYEVKVKSRSYLVELQQGENRKVDIELGSIQMTGKTTKGGKPVRLRVELTSVASGEVFTGYGAEGTYSIFSLLPGAYLASVKMDAADNVTSSSTLHETVTVPDQPVFVKDFNLP